MLQIQNIDNVETLMPEDVTLVTLIVHGNAVHLVRRCTDGRLDALVNRDAHKLAIVNRAFNANIHAAVALAWAAHEALSPSASDYKAE